MFLNTKNTAGELREKNILEIEKERHQWASIK